jgi:hypothetical protein
MKRTITREEFDAACEAVWSEVEFQDLLPRRTDCEAKDVQGFATLGRVYLREMEDLWASSAGSEQALPSMRKLAAIFVRGMAYCGIRHRESSHTQNCSRD